MKKIIIIATIIFLSLIFSAQAQSLNLLSKITGYESRDIYLQGEVNSESARLVIDSLQKLDQSSNEDITLHINSPGGSVYDGLSIYDAIHSVHSDVRTICEGLCASMAAFILSSGTHGKREAEPNSTIMVHELSFGAEGKLADVRVQLKEAERLQNLMNQILMNNTGQSLANLNIMLSSDNFLSPDDAKKYGLIDIVQLKGK